MISEWFPLYEKNNAFKGNIPHCKDIVLTD